MHAAAGWTAPLRSVTCGSGRPGLRQRQPVRRPAGRSWLRRDPGPDPARHRPLAAPAGAGGDRERPPGPGRGRRDAAPGPSAGVRLAIDDFGTGYAALGQLARMPFDLVKIERSFVTTIGTDPRAESLVAGIVDLARRLGVEVVAEGIEDGVQLARLRGAGCAFGQGFHFAAPMPPAELATFLADHAAASHLPLRPLAAAPPRRRARPNGLAQRRRTRARPPEIRYRLRASIFAWGMAVT